jgi:hypothetical protein
MKRLLIAIIAAGALAVPATASAWFGHHGQGDRMLLAAVSGTGTSFASGSATASGSVARGMTFANGTFSLTLSTTWSSAKTFSRTRDNKSFSVSCAPATATFTLTAGSTTKTLSLTGRTCSLTLNGTTRYGFMGRDSTNHAGAFLRENGTTVRGLVAGLRPQR